MNFSIIAQVFYFLFTIVMIVVLFCGVSWAVFLLSQALWCFEYFQGGQIWLGKLKERFNLRGVAEYQLTPRLVAMLNALPRVDKRIFPMTYACAIDSLKKLRKRAATKFQNPVLLGICFKSYRHWGGSMLAPVTNGNILVIKKMLRHKSIQNTMKYIHTIEFKEEDYEETVATTPEEIRQLGKAGWAKYDEMTINGTQMHFYRKPKRFGGLKTSL